MFHWLLPLQEDMGGFTFENSREVLCWVNFVLQRPVDGEHQRLGYSTLPGAPAVHVLPCSIEQAARAACPSCVALAHCTLAPCSPNAPE